MIQNLMDGILTGSIISLGAIGLTMVMHMLRFANFAYAELLAIGAYAALVFDRLFAALVPVMDQSFGGLSLTWTLTLATLAAMAVTGASAVIIDWAIFKRIREKADALSMVNFEPEYLATLIALGESDTASRADEILAFLSGGSPGAH